jgi:hypothetical protein
MELPRKGLSDTSGLTEVVNSSYRSNTLKRGFAMPFSWRKWSTS